NISSKTLTRQSAKRKAGLISLVLLLFVSIYGLLFYSSNKLNTDITENNLPTILILPFDNLLADKQHDAFVDGITEDIITDLSRLSNLFVFASNTSFQYKGKQVTPQQLRKELNVDYVLKGSIRRVDKSLRLNVQLVDTKTNFNVWAERYDRKVDEVFAIQSELTQQFINALTVKLTSHEKQQLVTRSTLNLQAYDHFLSGQRISKQRTKESNEQARIEYRRAIKLDPSYGRVYGALAFSMAVDYRRGWTDTPIETLDRALALAEQATLLDINAPQTYWVLGYVYMMRKELDAAERAAKQSIAIAPNYADGYGLLALINNHHGNAEKALKLIKKGMQLNPYYTFDYPYNLGRAYYSLGRYKEAITALEQAQERNENVMPVKLFLTASYIKTGRIDDAQWLVEQILVLTPGTTVSHIDKTIPIDNRKLKKVFLEDLRTAGLPE
ncbi:MAG: tetratricopeptide repeat protein, partial [Gammaproteobacteria bacterium]|nr:tetratricopeptide repeat protein [Gammaproteobacteria bacterium]